MPNYFKAVTELQTSTYCFETLFTCLNNICNTQDKVWFRTSNHDAVTLDRSGQITIN